jgi:hypothetical protein
MLSPYSKQNQINSSLALKLNIADTLSMLFPYVKTIEFNKFKDSLSDVLNSNIVASNNGIELQDATINTKGILKLAGDLTGTANAPTIADGVISDNKIAAGISASKVGLGNVNNTTDISKPISTLTQDALNLKLNINDTAVMLSNYLNNIHTTNNLLDTKLNKSDTAAMLNNYLANIHTTKNALDTKLNMLDTTAMLSNYLINIHTTKNALDTKLNKTDTASMLSNYLINIHTTKNALDTKLNMLDTTAMLRNYLTNIHTTKNALDTKLTKSDTAAMLNNYLTNIHTTKNALDTKLNKLDTTAMLSNYLTNIHTTKNVLDTKESTANKSNDATLGGISPSASLYPTQSAVKQYIINNTGAGSISATSITGVVSIANGGSGQNTANAAFNALAPSQTSNSGKYLTTNGTNTSWANIVTPWSVLGNAGMIDGTNFIGTTDAQPLNFKVNNTNAGRIDVSDVIGQTSFGFGAANNTIRDLNLLNGLKNTAIGYQALNHANMGKENTAIGYQALVNETSGSGSIAIGFQAMNNMNNTNSYGFISSQNIGIGYQVMQGSSTQSNNTGISNIAIGYHSMNNIETGANNTAIGTGALYNISTGNYNIALGANSLIFNTTGHYNTALGSQSLKYTIGSGNTSIGYGSGITPTTGTNNTFIGYGADANGGYTNATAIGNGAIVKASNTIVIGNAAIESLTTAGALKTTNATLSSSSLTGALIVAGGAGIGGDINIAGSATISGTTTLSSISYGMTPLTNDNSTKLATTAYVKNVIAGISTSTSSSSGWALTGNTGIVDGTNFIGTTDAQPLNFVANNINSGRIDVAALSGQTSFGYGSAVSTLKNTSNFYGTKNTSIGYQTLYNTVYGKENTAIGYQALYNNNTASGSTAIGYQAMYNAYNISTASAYSTSNTAVGYQALLGSSTPGNNSGISNTAIGHYAERSNSSGSNNTGIGDLSLYYNTTGQSNTAIGYNTLSSITNGSSNTAIGYNADVTNNVNNSTAIGNGATTNADNTIQLGNSSVTTVNASGTVNASEDMSLKHLKGTTAKPTVTFYGVNIGISDLIILGTDLGGFIQFTTRSSTTKDIALFSINFAKIYPTSPYVVLTATNAAASTLPVFVNASSTMFYVFPSSTTPLGNTLYSWNYIVVQ